MRSSTNGPSKLYVGDLGQNKKSDIARLFSKYGHITTIYCDENKHFAFVEFSSPADAQRALERTNNKTVNGSKLRVEFAKADRSSRTDHRRASSRDPSPASIVYTHLQFTANRLPPMQTFRQSYHLSTVNSFPYSSSNSTRGRSLTPPSLKNNFRFPGSKIQIRSSGDNSYPSMNNETTSYRLHEDLYSMQRLPTNSFLSKPRQNRSTNSMSRDHQRSRSRHRSSPLARHQSNGEKKRQRRSESSSSNFSSSSTSNQKQARERGPRTPPPVKKKARSDSNENLSTSERRLSSSLSSDDEEKQIDLRRNRKHSKRKTRE